MKAFNADLQTELEDRLRFETLPHLQTELEDRCGLNPLAELSARFVNLSPDRVDQEIEDALRCLVEALHADRSTLGRITEDGRDIVVTHAIAAPGQRTFPLFPSYKCRFFWWSQKRTSET